MDDLPIFDYVKVSTPSLITAVCITDEFYIIGLSSGTVKLANIDSGVWVDSGRFKSISKPVTLISASGESYCYCSSAAGEFVVVTPQESSALSPLSHEYLPIHSMAISPGYTTGSRRIAVAGGNSPDLVVLSQEGSPFPSISVSKDPLARGPIDQIQWQDEFLVWSGSEMGVKIMNTQTGEKIAHIQLLGQIRFNFSNNVLIVLNNLDLLVAQLSAGTCEIKSKMKFDSREFESLSLKKSVANEWWDSVLEKPGAKKKIIGFSLFDVTDQFSLSLLTLTQNSELILSLIDTNKSDLYISDLVSRDVSSSSISFASYADHTIIGLEKTGILVRRRSVADHCNWLMERGFYEKAVKIANMNSKNDSLRSHVFSQCLRPLIIDLKMFDLVQEIVTPAPPIPWSTLIEYFVSFPTGQVLADSLKALIRILPYPPKHSLALDQSDYDTVIDALLRNADLSGVELLQVVRTWPSRLFSSERLRDRLGDFVDENFSLSQDEKDRLIGKGITGFPGTIQAESATNTVALALSLKILYDTHGEYQDSLSILLRLRCMDELFIMLQDRIIQSDMTRQWFDINLQTLMQMDTIQSVKFSINNIGLFPAPSVIARLADQPFLKHVYLRELFLLSPEATTTHQDEMVSSFIHYDTDHLRGFLETATHYRVDQAVDVVRKSRQESSRQTRSRYDHLIQCEALLLWRTQRHVEAVDLLLNVAQEIQTAVAFAADANDPELWNAILSKVRQKESELLPPFLKALLQMPPSNLPIIAQPERVLRQALFPHNIPGLLPIANEILGKEERRMKMAFESSTLVKADWRTKRTSWNGKNRTSVTRIDPSKSSCKICQLRLCSPSPGGEGESDLFLNTVTRISDNIPVCSRAGSALFVVISGTELVHSKCLVRTATDFPRNIG